jgi:hypothetical protein
MNSAGFFVWIVPVSLLLWPRMMEDAMELTPAEAAAKSADAA